MEISFVSIATCIATSFESSLLLFVVGFFIGLLGNNHLVKQHAF
jgi:hypothetical protein